MLTNKRIIKTLNVWAWAILILGVSLPVIVVAVRNVNITPYGILIALFYILLSIVTSFMIFALTRTFRAVLRIEEKQEEIINKINSSKQYC